MYLVGNNCVIMYLLATSFTLNYLYTSFTWNSLHYLEFSSHFIYLEFSSHFIYFNTNMANQLDRLCWAILSYQILIYSHISTARLRINFALPKHFPNMTLINPKRRGELDMHMHSALTNWFSDKLTYNNSLQNIRSSLWQ